jgi:glycine/D-amino acid oxidase-like deaminating enzyme
LGAGLTGSCTALELAQLGYDVLLIERDSVAMNRASLRNEGKIHLGLIYAADRTLVTAFKQLDGALRFRSLLNRWLGDAVDHVSISAPFRYLVAKDSVLTPNELEQHFRSVEERYHTQLSKDPTLDYLGRRPEKLFGPHKGTGRAYFKEGFFAAEFDTAELAFDTADLAAQVRASLHSNRRIDFQPDHLVTDIEDRGSHVRVTGTSKNRLWVADAKYVINATWENRLKLDHRFGLNIPPGWLHRLKYRIIARLPNSLSEAPSATMVTGRYGDVVVRPDGTAYLSWYPAGMQGWTHDIAPPDSWDPVCRGDVPENMKTYLTKAFLRNIDEWFPGIGNSVPLLIDAGAIVAYGTTDVDDRSSGLHHRSHIGVNSIGGRYLSVDPGKMTTAPLFAQEAANRVANLIKRENKVYAVSPN